MTITQDQLSNFYGTSQWYKHWTGNLTFTDGIQYLNSNGAGWLVDAIASYQGSRKLSTQRMRDFQLWKLKVNGNAAVLTCREDTGKPAAITQEIEYTDFPFDIKIYVEGGVMLLPSEH